MRAHPCIPIPCTVTMVFLVSGSTTTGGSREAVQDTELSPRFRSTVDTVKMEEAVTMKPVIACTPSDLGRLFTAQENLGRGLASVVQVRLMLIEPVGGLMIATGGVSPVVRTVANGERIVMSILEGLYILTCYASVCACASEVYGSVFVCLCMCLCRLLQLLKDQ